MTKTLNQRLKTGELYVVYRGVTLDGISFLCYGDSEQSPRIYGKGNLDERVGNIPVCKSLETADKRLGPNTQAAFVPLSALMQGGILSGFRPYQLRQWASAQRHVAPDDVIEYLAKWVKEHPPECSHLERDHEIAKSDVVFAHTSWIKRNPNGTLGELLEFLDAVRHELYQYDSDDLIADHIDDLSIAAFYLSDFEDDDETFDIRVEGVDEDIESVEELIAFDGESFKVADLPTKDELLNRMQVAG